MGITRCKGKTKPLHTLWLSVEAVINPKCRETTNFLFAEKITMAKHEFGIMPVAPQPGKRYDQYGPWKYGCISVDDDYLEGIIEKLTSIDFYWHTLSVKGKGLAYCGITLIPPSSLSALQLVYSEKTMQKLE